MREDGRNGRDVPIEELDYASCGRSVITMVELTKVYGQLASTYYDYIGVGILTAAIYFLLGLPFVRLARWAETRLATDKRTVVTARRRWFSVGAKPATG